ncbi:hypothetical protein T4A_5022 [Trichinella pseudospiralis]|uniref:Uncharacterized protein n=1 Tax=Trichinella pseudospiralis TaxID=6337 RepID=A0A0V1E6M3_TRIPS|nr:hypothetical protein T4A_5022 [Trichinella pseudospiralis]
MVANGILRLSNKCQQMYMLIDNEQKKKDGKATFGKLFGSDRKQFSYCSLWQYLKKVLRNLKFSDKKK